MQSMKGITPVIAIILLLLITISMVGFAFVWFQRVATTATGAADTQLQNQLNQQGKTLAIDNINPVSSIVTLRHTGTVAADTSQAAVYVNNAKVTCTWDTPGSWAPGASRSCTASPTFTCTGNTIISISAPGNKDSAVC